MYKKAFHFHNAQPARSIWQGPRGAKINELVPRRVADAHRAAWLKKRALQTASNAHRINQDLLRQHMRGLQACLWMVYREWKQAGARDYNGRMSDDRLRLLLDGARVLALRMGDHPAYIEERQQEWARRFDGLRKLPPRTATRHREKPPVATEKPSAKSPATTVFMGDYCHNRLPCKIRGRHLRRCKMKKWAESKVQPVQEMAQTVEQASPTGWRR